MTVHPTTICCVGSPIPPAVRPMPTGRAADLLVTETRPPRGAIGYLVAMTEPVVG